MKLSFKKKEGPQKLELSMTSMIDVVFLLLIFFLVTTTFVKSERQLRPAIKVNDQSVAKTQSDLQPAIVKVVPGAQGFVYRLGSRDFTDVGELTEVLEVFENKYDGAFVMVSDNAPFQKAADAIQACTASGFVGVTYVPLKSNE